MDPVAGSRKISNEELARFATEAIVLYRDSEGITGLKYGDRGQSVLKLQVWLKGENLYTGPLDGLFGPLTRLAVRKVQRSAGLEPTGRVDSLTAAAISAGLSYPGSR